MSSTASRIIKNTVWLYAKMGITMFISLYTTRLILQGLGVSDFGIYNIVGGAINMLGFLYGAMSNATQRFMNYAEGEGKSDEKKIIFNVSILLHLCIAILISLVLIGAGFLFFNGILNIPQDRLFAAYVVYGGLVISTAFTILSVPYDAVLISHENMKYAAFVGILESGLKLLVAFICIYTSLDRLIVYGLLMASIPIILRIVMRIYCHRNYCECELNFSNFFRKDILKKLTGFAGWNFLTSVSSLFSHYGLGITLNHFFGSTLNAAQGIASQMSGTLMNISSNALKAINPVLTKSEGAKDKQQVFYLISIGSRTNFIIFAFFSIPIIFYAPEILKIWLKNVPEWAVVFCQLQLIRNLFGKLYGNMGSAVYAQGAIRNYTIVKSICNIMPLPIVIYAFVNNLPSYSMYIIWIICWEVLGGLTIAYYCRKLVGLSMNFYCKDVLAPCLAVLFSTTLLLFMTKTILPTFLTISIYGCTYSILSWAIVLSSKEKQLITSLINKKLLK